jgi:raffinose/stachyose/melibiose transport system permease protein
LDDGGDTNWNIFDARFAGFENYKNILTNPKINIAFKNTIYFTIVTTFFKMILGLFLAIVLNREIRTANIMRSIYFMPAIISNVAIALIFSSILHPDGILNSFLKAINMDFLVNNWLTDPNLVMFSVSSIEVWKWTGFTMVILLAGLQSIPTEYYEACKIDGATGFDKFRYITFPLLMPSFNNALIICLVGGLKVFDIVYALTGGGPGNASEVLNTYVFKAYGRGYYGEACAASVIIGVLIATISLFTLKPLRSKEVEM